MWKLAACLCWVAAAKPHALVCNDPRFEPGSVMMGVRIREGTGSSPQMSVSTTSFSGGSSVDITFNSASSSEKNDTEGGNVKETRRLLTPRFDPRNDLSNAKDDDKDTYFAFRALPKYGYTGHYGSFSKLSAYSKKGESGDDKKGPYLQQLCTNTAISYKKVKEGKLTWTAHKETYGEVDLTMLWGDKKQVFYKTITLTGPEIPSIPPQWHPTQLAVDVSRNATNAHDGMSTQHQLAEDEAEGEPVYVDLSSRRRSAPTPSPSPCLVNGHYTCSCVAPTDGTYNLPDAPVFHQKLKSKTVIFPAGQCVPCRDDYADKCVSARVECPKQPGELAVQHLFMSEDCSDEPAISNLPTQFVHCPGPEQYSPDYLDLERFVNKLQRDHASYFPDENTTRLALAEYRRMLHIIQKFPDVPAVPSKLVDLVWHEHILDTQTYRHDSQRLFGKYIHHAPSFGDDTDEDVKAEKLEMVDQQKEMLELYVELFGDHPNTEIWPLATSSVPGMGEGRLPDCCKGACVKVNCVTCVGCNAVDCGKLRADEETATRKKNHVLPDYFAGYVPLPHELENQTPKSATTYLCQMQPMRGMTLKWTISGQNIFMQQTLETSVAETWHSVGFTNVPPYNMGFADYVVSLFADYNGASYSGVRDLYKYDEGNHYPCWDVLQQCSLTGKAGTQDLQGRSAVRSGGTSVSSWYRLLDTGDYKDSTITNATQKVMFARGANDEFTYHPIDSRWTCEMNFFTNVSHCERPDHYDDDDDDDDVQDPPSDTPPLFL